MWYTMGNFMGTLPGSSPDQSQAQPLVWSTPGSASGSVEPALESGPAAGPEELALELEKPALAPEPVVRQPQDAEPMTPEYVASSAPSVLQTSMVNYIYQQKDRQVPSLHNIAPRLRPSKTAEVLVFSFDTCPVCGAYASPQQLAKVMGRMGQCCQCSYAGEPCRKPREFMPIPEEDVLI